METSSVILVFVMMFLSALAGFGLGYVAGKIPRQVRMVVGECRCRCSPEEDSA